MRWGRGGRGPRRGLGEGWVGVGREGATHNLRRRVARLDQLSVADEAGRWVARMIPLSAAREQRALGHGKGLCLGGGLEVDLE